MSKRWACFDFMEISGYIYQARCNSRIDQLDMYYFKPVSIRQCTQSMIKRANSVRSNDWNWKWKWKKSRKAMKREDVLEEGRWMRLLRGWKVDTTMWIRERERERDNSVPIKCDVQYYDILMMEMFLAFSRFFVAFVADPCKDLYWMCMHDDVHSQNQNQIQIHGTHPHYARTISVQYYMPSQLHAYIYICIPIGDALEIIRCNPENIHSARERATKNDGTWKYGTDVILRLPQCSMVLAMLLCRHICMCDCVSVRLSYESVFACTFSQHLVCLFAL